MLRAIYKLLSVLSMLGAARRGRLGRYMIRRSAMRGIARGTRRIKF